MSHADTPLLLHALSQHIRERTLVAAAEDYFSERRWLDYLMGIWLNSSHSVCR